MSQSYLRLKELISLVIIPEFDLRLWLDLDWVPRFAFDCMGLQIIYHLHLAGFSHDSRQTSSKLENNHSSYKQS